MSQRPTVLSHLATKFAAHPENLATEALGFVLASSLEARAALGKVLAGAGYQVHPELEYETQEANDSGSRPDVVGRIGVEQPSVLIEAKFWAGLTAAQPVEYLQGLPATGGALLFVTPATRLELVWAELLRRVRAAGLRHESLASLGQDLRFVRVGAHLLAITSWRALLTRMLDAMHDVNDSAAASDVQQIFALCERMDSEAFLPLTQEELSSTAVGRRILQFGDLASTVTDVLVQDGLASVKKLRATGGNGWFGRYVALKGHGALISFNARRWSQWGDSPLWLDLQGPDWRPSATVREKLKANNVPFRDLKLEGCSIALHVPPDVEWDQVVESLVAQVRRVVCLLPDISQPDVPLPPPPTNELAGDDGGVSGGDG